MRRRSGIDYSFVAALAVAIVVFVALIGYGLLQANIQSNEASISYYCSGQAPSVSNPGNSAPQVITINCGNAGNADGNFTLSFILVNATFSTQTPKPYTELNSNTVGFNWLLHKGDSATKEVYYSIASGVSGFSLSLTIEKNSAAMETNAMFPCNLQYSYNSTSQSFELTQSA